MRIARYGAAALLAGGLAGLLAPAPAAALTDHPDGATFQDCPECPEMVALKKGTLLLGSREDEIGRRPDEGPRRRIRIPRFAIAKTETTFAQWDACVADGFCRPIPPGGPDQPGTDRGYGRGQHPVIEVTWFDIVGLDPKRARRAGLHRGYLAWLNARAPGLNYRLPSEAEWEYAARGGKRFAFPWGDRISRSFANFGGNQSPGGRAEGNDGWVHTAPVGSFKPNPFGLSDMIGNVWEWVQDCYHPTYRNGPFDGSAWMERNEGDCGQAVLRGGSWANVPINLRVAVRFPQPRQSRGPWFGFRVVRDLPQPPEE